MDPEQIQRKNQLPRVIIIGAGIGGLQSIRYLKDVCQVICFESANKIGGLWNYREKTEYELSKTQMETSFKQYGYSNSSLFDGMKQNIPKYLMAFKGLPINKKYPQFLNAQEFLNYIEKYSRKHKLKQYIKFQQQVQLVKVYKNMTKEEITQISKYHSAHAQNEFKNSKFVAIIRLKNKIKHIYYADYIVCCNGKFRVPLYPNIQQLSSWDGKVTHSHTFRQKDLKDYKDKHIAVYGSGFSAISLITNILKNSEAKRLTVIGSISMQSLSESTDFSRDIEQNRLQIQIGIIAKLEFNKLIILEENEQIENVDHLILATGYKYSFPFLDQTDQIITQQHNQNKCQGPLYLKMISINHPEVFFISLLHSFLNLSEKQCILMRQLVSKKASIPSKEQMFKECTQDVNIAKQLTDDFRRYFYLNEDQERFYVEKLAGLCGMEVDEEQVETNGRVRRLIVKKLSSGDYASYRDLDFSHIFNDKYSPSIDKF